MATTARRRTLPHFTLADVRKHSSEHDCWVLRGRSVYDVSLFLHDHPGGGELLVEYAGKDVDKVMKDAMVHSHSEGAWEILDDYLIGTLAPGEKCEDADSDADSAAADVRTPRESVRPVEAEELDAQEHSALMKQKQHLLNLNEPLLWQMLTSNFSKQFYLEQVHIARHLPEPAHIFHNPVLELCTRTPWYVVPLVWVPVVGYLLSESVHAFGATNAATLFAIGLVVWTFCEYTFHRFLFHVDKYLPDHRLALSLHFLMHGVHHFLPMDRMRLVLPPVFFALIVQPPWWFFRAFLSHLTVCGLFAGGIAGYIFYDLTHYYLHHARVRTGYMREMKKYHLAHHYKDYDAGYGITSKLWDYVFGSVLEYDEVPSPAAANNKAN